MPAHPATPFRASRIRASRIGVGRFRAGPLVAGLSALALFAAGCVGATSVPSVDTRTAAPSSSSSTTASSAPRELVAGLTTPWEVLSLADGSVLVSERDTKKIRRVQGSSVSDLITLDDVDPQGEGGLLGMALSPRHDTLFAYYTSAVDNRIVAMSWDGTRLGPPRVIFDGIPSGGRHNGGRIAIGPDDLLYVGTGEVGEPDLAQDKQSLGGKILRLSLDGAAAPGNPFGNEVWSYGHRNVEGLAFDPQGRLWASEFGEQTWDELNLVVKGGNYGWPNVEGSGRVDGMTNPLVVWRTEEASPAGLAYADGSLWMAALRGARVWQIPLSGAEPGTPRALLQGELGRIRTVTPVSRSDELLVVTSNTDGRGDVRAGDDRIVRISVG